MNAYPAAFVVACKAGKSVLDARQWSAVADYREVSGDADATSARRAALASWAEAVGLLLTSLRAESAL